MAPPGKSKSKQSKRRSRDVFKTKPKSAAKRPEKGQSGSKTCSKKSSKQQPKANTVDRSNDDLASESCESIISAASSNNIVPRRTKAARSKTQRQGTKEKASTAQVKAPRREDAEEPSKEEQRQTEEPETIPKNIPSVSYASIDSTISAAVTLPAAHGEPTVAKISQVILADGWQFHEEIGRGAFAAVYRVSNPTHYPDESPLACKMFDLRTINSNWTRRHLRTEMKITKMVIHPNVMSAVEVAKTSNHAFIFMRLAPNGTILSHMYDKLRRPIPENVARLWFKGLMAGLRFLHTHEIVHRDLKLDNFLLDTELQSPMITDFGFAVKGETNVLNVLSATIQRAVNAEPAVMCETVCGTPEYVAPEVHLLPIGKRYDGKPVDMYAMGVSLFEMVNLTKPFRGGPFLIRSQILINLQQRCELAFNPRVKLSSKCNALIMSLVKPKASSRPTAQLVYKDDWLTKN